MLGRFFAAAIVLAAMAAPAAAQDRGQAREQVDFGIRVAQQGLWREAIYRWERAVEIDPTYAAAHNNLAIAYEHQGNLEQARTAYERAMALEPGNQYIQQNYELFMEINERATDAEDR